MRDHVGMWVVFSLRDLYIYTSFNDNHEPHPNASTKAASRAVLSLVSELRLWEARYAVQLKHPRRVTSGTLSLVGLASLICFE